MPFYVYYGKLDKDLLVAVLPNGTIEVDDKIHLSSKKGFFSYRARAVEVSTDGEDVITFADAHASFTAVTKNGYKEIEVVRTIKNEKTTATLIRKYDQPKDAITSKNVPRIWAGLLQFHDWAKNEEIVVVAPKGLGNKKPIVAIWQWTKDINKEQGTLSHSVTEQKSEAATPGKFSFQQNGYYTVTCDVALDGLNLKLKGPADQGANNSEVSQEMLKSAKIDLGAEARFTPPRATQTKMELDCSFPAAQPHIKRMTQRLPFPAGLIESLQHTAAYLDHAGGLAKHANQEFDKLSEINEKLEKRIHAKDEKIKGLDQSNRDSTKANNDLKADLAKERDNVTKEKKEKEAAEDKVKKILLLLAASEAREKRLQKDIDADKLADIKREKAWQDHHAEDMQAYQMLEEDLEKERCANRDLKEDLAESSKKVKSLKSDLEHTEDLLEAAETRICGLTTEVSFWKAQAGEVKDELDRLKHELEQTQLDRDHFRDEATRLDGVISTQKVEIESLKNERDALDKKLQSSQLELRKKEAEFKIKLKKARDDFAEDIAARDEKLRLKEKENEALDTAKDRQEQLHEAEIKRKNDRIRELEEENENATTNVAPTSVVDALKGSVGTVTTAEIKTDA